jgi:dephospho-CoA kinase
VARARGASALTRRRSLRIGLTGPIGCGKSTVAGWLAERGAAVIDADRLAREVVEPDQPAFAAIVAAFGPEVVGDDGRLDRAALGRLVFSDPGERARLEAITGPAVRPRILAAIDEAEAVGAPVVVLEAIRLVEGGYVESVDEVWLVTCEPEVQRRRLADRGMLADDVAARMAAQTGLVERVIPVATRVLDTSGPVAATRTSAEALLRSATEERLE